MCTACLTPKFTKYIVVVDNFDLSTFTFTDVPISPISPGQLSLSSRADQLIR